MTANWCIQKTEACDPVSSSKCCDRCLCHKDRWRLMWPECAVRADRMRCPSRKDLEVCTIEVLEIVYTTPMLISIYTVPWYTQGFAVNGFNFYFRSAEAFCYVCRYKITHFALQNAPVCFHRKKYIEQKDIHNFTFLPIASTFCFEKKKLYRRWRYDHFL